MSRARGAASPALTKRRHRMAEDRIQENRETRECRSCNGHGLVLVDCEYDPTTGELTEEVCECFICRGAGVVPLFLYTTPRPRS